MLLSVEKDSLINTNGKRLNVLCIMDNLLTIYKRLFYINPQRFRNFLYK